MRGVSDEMSWAKLEQIARHIGTSGGDPRYWPPHAEHADKLWVMGDGPPEGHIWWRDATQIYLGMERCQEFGVPAFTLRRK